MTYHNRYLADILKTVEYMDAHYKEEIRIENLTQLSHLSETHFRRKFSEYMKITPGDYINLLRVKKHVSCFVIRIAVLVMPGNPGRIPDRQCIYKKFP